MVWDDLSETYANLGYPGEGEGKRLGDLVIGTSETHANLGCCWDDRR